MRKFEVGDRIKCVDKTCSSLIYGKTYDVIGMSNGDKIYVIDEDGDKSDFHSYRFILDIVFIRNEVIDEILN